MNLLTNGKTLNKHFSIKQLGNNLGDHGKQQKISIFEEDQIQPILSMEDQHSDFFKETVFLNNDLDKQSNLSSANEDLSKNLEEHSLSIQQKLTNALLKGAHLTQAKTKNENYKTEILEFGFEDEQLCKKWVVLLRWLAKLNSNISA